MKKLLLFLSIMIFSLSVFSQNYVKIVSQDENETVLKFVINDFKFEPVRTSNGEAFIVKASDMTQIAQKGAPDVPKFTASLIIPDDRKMNVEVLSFKAETYSDIKIAPSKGNLTRDIDPSTLPFEYGQAYSINDFYPYKKADKGNPYIIRDFRGEAFYAYPFAYNPVTQELKVYKEITVRIYADGQGQKNILKRSHPLQSISFEFNEIYKNHFLNYGYYASKYTPLEEEGNMLIIAYDDFVDEMNDFVLWKNTIGRHTEIIPLSQVGSTAADIKSYVENYYNTNGLTYLLLVGDAEQVPTNSGSGLGGDSDNAYGYLTGDDHYQELFVGRFSAQSEADVTTMVQRTITYEKGDELASNWLNKPLAIASDQGPGDDDEYDYQHARNMLTDLLNFTYTDPPYEYYDGSQGGNDAAGNPQSSDVANGLNQGAGIVTYTGHGSDLSWATSGFSTSDVHNLNNVNKLPFIWSVACVVGNFVSNNECFAESWLRATDANGNPTGAIAFFGSTINQSWAPPMVAQDEMVDILVESYDNNIKRTFAGLSINGCFLMNDETSDYDMTDTWTVFGDPSVYVRTDNPAQMTITHDDVIIYGTSSFSVSCDFNGALATISKDGQIISKAYVEGGIANIELDQTLYQPGDEVTLAVVGFNKVTYLTTLEVIAPEGPFITMSAYSVNDTNYLLYGKTQNMKIELKNVGVQDASGVSAILTSHDGFITLTNNAVDFGDIAQGQTVSNANFTVTVSYPEDMYNVPFHLIITDNSGNTWEKDFTVTVYAPDFSSSKKAIADSGIAFVSIPKTMAEPGKTYSYNIEVSASEGNGNHNLDPGENAIITFLVANIGHAPARNVEATLTCNSSYITISNPVQSAEYVNANDFTEFPFSIQVDDSIPLYQPVDFTLIVKSDIYTDTLILTEVIGLIVEDFETGGFSLLNWQHSGDLDWEITTQNVYEGIYSAAAPEALSDNQSSSLSLQLNNVPAGGELLFYYKVSSEENYDFLKFYINGTEVGSWSGEVDWSGFNYIFSDAGDYNLTWTYEKDQSVSEGSDIAWIDYIILPVMPTKKSRNITISADTIPDWLALSDNGDGTALLSGEAPTITGTYRVKLTATDGLTTGDQSFNIEVSVLANIIEENKFSIYPNPATDYLNLVLPSGKYYDISIIDMNGKVVFKTYAAGASLIKVADLNSGVYIVKISGNNESYSGKIIVDR